MTELERRALLGDREAQEDCTNGLNMLSCPKCGDRVYMCIDEDRRTFKCACGLSFTTREPDALLEWNTRVAPPIGRCGECAHWINNDEDRYGNCHINDGILTNENEYCYWFEPKGGEGNAAD